MFWENSEQQRMCSLNFILNVNLLSLILSFNNDFIFKYKNTMEVNVLVSQADRENQFWVRLIVYTEPRRMA